MSNTRQASPLSERKAGETNHLVPSDGLRLAVCLTSVLRECARRVQKCLDTVGLLRVCASVCALVSPRLFARRILGFGSSRPNA